MLILKQELLFIILKKLGRYGLVMHRVKEKIQAYIYRESRSY